MLKQVSRKRFGFKFRYASCLDKFQMTISVLLTLIASGVYPLAFIVYGNVVNTLVDLQKSAILSSLDRNVTSLQIENVSLSDSQDFW